MFAKKSQSVNGEYDMVEKKNKSLWLSRTVIAIRYSARKTEVIQIERGWKTILNRIHVWTASENRTITIFFGSLRIFQYFQIEKTEFQFH